MTDFERLQKIQRVLESQNIPAKPIHLAKILDVAPSSLYRWLNGEMEPRGKQKERVDILYRIACEVEKNNSTAEKILRRLIKPVGYGMGMAGIASVVAPLSLGIAGVLFAAGLGWLLVDKEDDDEEN